ncbi:MAG TPA: hypothetical protein PLS63_06325 [Microthrixaceae bacterium]|nr:hypothetical protein [Microthrixaceae bacterium]
MTHSSNHYGTRRLTRAVLGSLVAVGFIAAAACTPDPGPTSGAALTSSASTSNVAPGTVVTVTGAGYNPAANIGSRPPLWGQPAGVYVAFACVTDPWKPSAGATSANRAVIEQFWAVPSAAAFQAIGGAESGAIMMDANGGFAVDVTLTAAPCAGRYAIITLPGSGAPVNPGEENEIPVTFAAQS